MERQYILDAIDAALCAGKDILSIYNDPTSDFQIEKKADNSPLTIADKKAHAAIAGYLQKTPYPLLSEEGKHLPYTERCAWTTLWIVDPLDGTKEFIKRNGEFTVNIALVRNSVPVMGVIYLPVKQELYFAEETLGAYKLSDFTARSGASLEELMAKAVRLPIKDNHDKFVIVASRSHLSPETEDYIEKMKRCHSDVELISSGSSIKYVWWRKVRRMYIPVLLPPWNGIRQQGMPLHVLPVWKCIRPEKKNRYSTIRKIC